MHVNNQYQIYNTDSLWGGTIMGGERRLLVYICIYIYHMLLCIYKCIMLHSALSIFILYNYICK